MVSLFFQSYIGKRKRRQIEGEVDEAMYHNDLRRERHALKALGGRGRGPKKRSSAVGMIDMPTRKEWQEPVSQPTSPVRANFNDPHA